MRARTAVLSVLLGAASGPLFAAGGGSIRVYIEDGDGKPMAVKELKGSVELAVEGGKSKTLTLAAKTPAHPSAESRRHGGETRAAGERTVEFVVTDDPADPKDSPCLEAATGLPADAKFTAELTLTLAGGLVTLKGFRHPPGPPDNYREAIAWAKDALDTARTLIDDGKLKAVGRYTARFNDLCDAAVKMFKGGKAKMVQGERKTLDHLLKEMDGALKKGDKDGALAFYFEASEHLDVMRQFGEK